MPAVVRIALWNLADSDVTVAQLREYIRTEAMPAFETVHGLLFKTWVSHESSDRWGVVDVFESPEAAEQPLPYRARELIGRDADIVEVFDVEATIAIAPQLARLGLAFES
jgi:hypothetical protein